MGEPTGVQKVTMTMGRGDVDVSGPSDFCYNAPSKYHKPGAIHFTNKERTEFVRGCRYCDYVFTYNLDHTESGKLKSTRENGAWNDKSQPTVSDINPETGSAA